MSLEPAWSPADDAALFRQQLVERAALDLVLGDPVQAATYLALLAVPLEPLMTFGAAVLAAERRRESRGEY